MNAVATALLVVFGSVGVQPLEGARGESPVKPRRLVVAADKPNVLDFPTARARLVRLAIRASSGGEPCLDELEVYAPGGARNLAHAGAGAKASASSCLAGYAIHRVDHLNDGQYGNDHSWVAATTGEEWAQVELPAETEVARVVFSRDRNGVYHDRLPSHVVVQLSTDGRQWTTACEAAAPGAPVPPPSPLTWDALLRYAFERERDMWEVLPQDDALSPAHADRPALPGGAPYWGALAKLDGLSRVVKQTRDLLDRLAARGLDVTAERNRLADVERRRTAATDESLYFEARADKRRLFFRDPELAPLRRILFVKRHPYTPSHNYSDILDSAFRPGGGVCVLEIPRDGDRLDPAAATVKVLFDAKNGIARDAVADFDARRVTFAYRPSDRGESAAYWHLMTSDADGAHPRQLTDGPFHDYYPCPLPDGGLAFISTRCKARFLCWRPQAFVMFRMDAAGANITPLSHANLSEWAPSLMRDGRILWTRSEYLDKGADFGHTLWAIRPDGTHPALLYGNDTRNCYVNGREVPGTAELCCTLCSHGGDLNGPVALVDTRRGPFGADAVTNITPDVRPRYHMDWAARECFRDPVPVSRDHVLVSHAPSDRFGIYVIDRYGNREVLFMDPTFGSMCPTPLRAVPRPPALGTDLADKPTPSGEGQFVVADVYQGLEPAVARGAAKYIRVCQEVRSELERLPDGAYRKDHEPFQDFYASPTHRVTGPSGWPTYVAKASLGLAPVDADGSASFYAPAGKVLYFQVLDANFNELQRMRSVVQLQAGERRGCVGCHENRTSAAPTRPATAARREPSRLEPPPWGAEPFSYAKVVQPVWDARCVSCHDAKDSRKLDLTGALDADRVPASYRTLITQGWVHYFDFTWGQEHHKADPLTFGTVKSRLRTVLDAEHHGVRLDRDEVHRVKCWIDLNCPLWPDYRDRSTRPLARVDR
jgi:Hydrazine synthase alpha subunit middle domain/F5/8 type C domain